MKKSIPIAMGLCVVVFGLVTVGCKQEKPAAQFAPHSPEAVNVELQQLQPLLSEAFKKNDLIFIHRQMYYIETLADALSHKLEGERKQRVDVILVSIKQVADELDNSAGRQHPEATGANLEKFYAVLKELDAEFKPKTASK